MSKAPLVVFISSIVPNPENHGGPSGLPWEMIESLKQNGWDVQLQVFPLPVNRIRRRLTQLSIPIEKFLINQKDADVYIVYPFYLGRLIPSELRSRAILLGPDATSMLYKRFARIQSGWGRWRSILISRWFVSQERWAAKHYAGIAVVGRNDVRWLRYFAVEFAAQIHYIPHPILSHVAQPSPGKGIGARPRLVFAGDLSSKYVGDFFQTINYKDFATALNLVDCELLVVGKGNRAVHNMISTHLPSQYVAWVEDYASLCDPLRDVHAIPLMAGAGTKNRTLTALAMNVIVVSTPIGTENVDATVLRTATVHRFRSSADFLQALTAALIDLQARRAIGVAPEPPPIARIAEAFQNSLVNLLKTVIPKSILP